MSDNCKQINPKIAIDAASTVAAAEAQEAVISKTNRQNAFKESNLPELVLISGVSGAGRTEAMHVLEDLGYYCIDNLPAVMLSSLVELERRDQSSRMKLAVVCDARNGSYFEALRDEINKLDSMNLDYKIIFLDASDDKLVARYKSSRRRHPMCKQGQTIAQGISKERSLLYPIKESANYVIDTTNILPQNLRSSLRMIFEVDNQKEGLSITVYSFGFKNGAAYDADVVIDVRFLPNPYWDLDLRPLSGLDAPVHDFVMARTQTKEFMKKWFSLLDTLVPGYVKEGKQQLAIAIGCTGGQHRSVAITEETGEYLKSLGYRVSVAHRDLAMAVAQAGGSESTIYNSTNPSVTSSHYPVLVPGLSGAWAPIPSNNS